MSRIVFFIGLAIFGSVVIACNQNKLEKIDPETYTFYQELGFGIATQTQGVLLANVSKAMQEGGSFYAVEFCNLQASSLVDSLKIEFGCEISRVTDKTRNPGNNLKTETDRQIWTYYTKSWQKGEMRDTLAKNANIITYYKPILTALPACLNCHGPEQDINQETYQKIKMLYPADKATSYNLNELRGMWKISWNEKM